MFKRKKREPTEEIWNKTHAEAERILEETYPPIPKGEGSWKDLREFPSSKRCLACGSADNLNVQCLPGEYLWDSKVSSAPRGKGTYTVERTEYMYSSAVHNNILDCTINIDDFLFRVRVRKGEALIDPPITHFLRWKCGSCRYGFETRAKGVSYD